ncbi:MAG: hypothetical protein H0W62_06500 [Chitinophagales bacterium]|nr:hypothetical protein [Chitinophagales bacterium]
MPIIFPRSPVLCPNTNDSLKTQPYNTYQWYRNNRAIPGATNQFYIVNHEMDVGSKLRVAVIDNGCTRVSRNELCGRFRICFTLCNCPAVWELMIHS